MDQDTVFKLSDQASEYVDKNVPAAAYEAKIWRNAYTLKFAELIEKHVRFGEYHNRDFYE
jgi:hypothetical protein